MTRDELKQAIDDFLCPDLRDRFATAAMTGLISAGFYRDIGKDSDVLAAEAYAIADSMMKIMSGGAPDADGSPSGTTPVSP